MRRHTAIVFLVLFFGATISPAYGLPTFSAAYGLNTLNAPLTASVTDARSVSVADGLVVSDPFFASRVTTKGSAEEGRLRLENSVKTIGPYAQSRSEVIVSFEGDIYFCASNSQSGGTNFDPNSCVSPAVPIGSLLPNIVISGSYAMSNGGSAVFSFVMQLDDSAVLSAHSDFSASQGDIAGTSSGGIASGLTMNRAPRQPDPGSKVGVLPYKANVKARAETIAGCGQPNCEVILVMAQSINFSETGPAFLGLDPAVSIWSPDLNIYDNRWYSPETLAAMQMASVPEPTSIALFGLGLAGLGIMVRRRKTY